MPLLQNDAAAVCIVQGHVQGGCDLKEDVVKCSSVWRAADAFAKEDCTLILWSGYCPLTKNPLCVEGDLCCAYQISFMYIFIEFAANELFLKLASGIVVRP